MVRLHLISYITKTNKKTEHDKKYNFDLKFGYL